MHAEQWLFTAPAKFGKGFICNVFRLRFFGYTAVQAVAGNVTGGVSTSSAKVAQRLAGKLENNLTHQSTGPFRYVMSVCRGLTRTQLPTNL